MKTKYILVTPAHNEGEYMEQLIEIVLAQTILPARWVIVDDASSDKTSQIAKSYSEQYDFIQYHRIEPGSLTTYYSRRTVVWLQGFEQIKNEQFDFVGALDADITLPPDYYENILTQFEKDSHLGIAAGVYVEKFGGKIAPIIPRHHESTSGGLQLFRKQCYADIGGYRPLSYGGDDTLAEIMARMKGWKTQSFPQYQAIHHRPVGQRGSGALRAKFRQGLTDYHLGSHVLFMMVKSGRRIFIERPYIISGICRFFGYLYGYIVMRKVEVPDDVKKFLRKEQLIRLLKLTDFMPPVVFPGGG